MKSGSLGELIAPNGQTDHYAWESHGGLTLIYTKDDAMRIIGKLYGPDPLRLERTAVLIGYLEGDVRTSE